MLKTIRETIGSYLSSVHLARSKHTAMTYKNAMGAFSTSLKKHGVDLDEPLPTRFPEESIVWLINDLNSYAPSSERLYLTATIGFFEFLTADSLSEVNLPKARLLIKQRARRPGLRLPQFPEDSIHRIVLHLINKVNLIMSNEPSEQLRYLRDRAFLIALADSGLRVHEACNLRRGDVDWNEGRAMIIGKGNRQDIARFSRRSIFAIREYLSVRAALDGTSGKPLGSLPIFARHDKGAGSKIKPLTTTSGRNIVNEWVLRIIGPDAVGTITPHSFRHYFVTRVLKSSGNLKLAQELARHKNIAVTQRYAHINNDELDKGYYQIFENSED
jgi:integrase/recombinase XerC